MTIPRSTSRNADRSCSPFRKKSLCSTKQNLLHLIVIHHMKYHYGIYGQNWSTSTSARQKRDSASEDILIQFSVLSKIKWGRTGLQIINKDRKSELTHTVGLAKYIKLMNSCYEIILPWSTFIAGKKRCNKILLSWTTITFLKPRKNADDHQRNK